MQIINGSKMIKKIIFYLVIISSSLFAQISDFEVMPNQINFMNRFERIKRVRMMNRGVNDVIIDSISYNSSILYIRNNNFSNYKLILDKEISNIRFRVTQFSLIKSELKITGSEYTIIKKFILK